ncbi:MAG: transketolase C-terminal domain-containing protein [Paracoccaceae bacterium]
MKNTFINTLMDAAITREDMVIATGDAGMGVWDTFMTRCPDRFLNLGIAEQNAIGVAAGLAFGGKRVVLYNIIPFLLFRAFEQVRNDICSHNLPVILCGIGAGVTYGPAGMTHYAIEDLGVARALPELTIYSPADGIEARLAAEHAMTLAGPSYARFAKKRDGQLHKATAFDLSQPPPLRDADDPHVVIATHGSIASETVAAVTALGEQGIRVKVQSFPIIAPLDAAQVGARLPLGIPILVVEEHRASCGLFGALASTLAAARLDRNLIPAALPERSLHEVRSREGFRTLFGIDAAGLGQRITELLGART